MQRDIPNAEPPKVSRIGYLLGAGRLAVTRSLILSLSSAGILL